MHIVIISCVYPPEPVVSAQLSANLMQALCQDGHQVTVITSFPNRPGGKLYVGYKHRFFQRETQKYGKVIRCWGTFSRQSRLISRFVENISFGITSSLVLTFLSCPDIIYSNSWPIFATGLITLVAKLRNIPLVVSIQDIYPESLIVQGRIPYNGRLIRMLRSIDTWIVHNSRAVVVLSEGFARIYQEDRKLSSDRLFIIPDWGNEADFIESNRENRIRLIHHFTSDDFVFGYGGNIGVAAGVEGVIRVMQRFITQEPIKLLIAGDGSRLASCKQLAEQGGNHNIAFHSPWPIEETSIVLAAVDALILPTSGEQALVSVPSKLINYMFAARPILALANTDSDIAKIIQQARCGWVIPPNQPEIMSKKMVQIAHTSKDQLVSYGRAGRQYAIEHFNKEENIGKLKNVLYGL